MLSHTHMNTHTQARPLVNMHETWCFLVGWQTVSSPLWSECPLLYPLTHMRTLAHKQTHCPFERWPTWWVRNTQRPNWTGNGAGPCRKRHQQTPVYVLRRINGQRGEDMKERTMRKKIPAEDRQSNVCRAFLVLPRSLRVDCKCS